MRFPVALILIEFKIRIEERFMTAEFPQEYPRYRRRVPQLVPALRVLTGHQDVAGEDGTGPPGALVAD